MGTLADLATLSVKASEEISLLNIFYQALDTIPNPVVITDVAGEILWVNTAFIKETGFAFSEVKGNNPRVLKSGQHDAEFYNNMWKTITAGSPWRGNIVNKYRDGSLHSEFMTITPIKNDQGVVKFFVAMKQLVE